MVKKKETLATPDSVDSLRRKKALGESVRNIGTIPPIKNINRRNKCKKSLLNFILEYAMSDKLPFSDDHKRIIKRMELCILHGGRFIEAVYRGFGKSTLTELAVVWAVLYSHKRFIPIVTANSKRSEEAILNIKTLLTTPTIREDFPEVCYPIERLEGINQRASGQLYTDRKGEVKNTAIKIAGSEINLPCVDGAFCSSKKPKFRKNLASNSKIMACGITSSAIRGMRHVLQNGSTIRPSLAILDDIQDEESASSPVQVNKRLDIIKKAVLKSAGHEKEMSVIMPCTVMAKDDLVDRLLNKKNYPGWQGERIPFVKNWSTAHETLWVEYAEIRNTYDEDDENDYLRARENATQFYIDNREAMDDGCEVAWEHCFYSSEISSVQHAYNSLVDDGEEVFQSEFQCDPMEKILEDGENIQLTRLQVEEKFMPEAKRLEIPLSVEKIVAFVDVQSKSLYWGVCGFSMDFTGVLLDYGVFPKQTKRVFKASEVDPTLFTRYPGISQEGVWYKGLTDLCEVLIKKNYIREDGADLPMSRLLLDANEGQARETIYSFCKTSEHKSIILPQLGRGITASSKPFNEYKKKKGDRVGSHWRIPVNKGEYQQVRAIVSDTNYFKTFFRERLKQSIGEVGSFSFFGKPISHPMLIDHMLSEYSIQTSGRGRTLQEWKPKPGITENHFFDILIGCHVAATEQGCCLKELHAGKTIRERKNKLSAKDRLAKLGNVRSVTNE